jgi:hypothetical protein
MAVKLDLFSARLIIESPSFEWPFPALAEARVDRAGMLDRHDLKLQKEGRQWINEISLLF